MEVSFPNAMREASLQMGHLSPCHLDSELAKMQREDVDVFLYHLKPAFLSQLNSDLEELQYPRIRTFEQGETLHF